MLPKCWCRTTNAAHRRARRKFYCEAFVFLGPEVTSQHNPASADARIGGRLLAAHPSIGRRLFSHVKAEKQRSSRDIFQAQSDTGPTITSRPIVAATTQSTVCWLDAFVRPGDLARRWRQSFKIQNFISPRISHGCHGQFGLEEELSISLHDHCPLRKTGVPLAVPVRTERGPSRVAVTGLARDFLARVESMMVRLSSNDEQPLTGSPFRFAPARKITH
jgi:hypothetical protein